MFVTIIAPGSRGDVQPYIALGCGLMAAGHRVCIVSSQNFNDLVTGYGLTFVAMGGDVEAAGILQQGLVEKGNMLKILAEMGRLAEDGAVQAAQGASIACQGADVVIGGLGGLFTGVAVAEKLGIPFILALYFPFTPTAEFPNALLPLPAARLPRWSYKLSHILAQQMMWQSFRGADNLARRRVLSMPPAPWAGPFGVLHRQRSLTLYGYSAHVVPRPGDWPDFAHVTGYWFSDPPAGWEAPADLLAFLQAGPPPVYVGFGSMHNRDPEAVAELVLQALARTGQRGVLSAGWGGLRKADLPDTVYEAGSMPHGWLFPRMAAVVHHGGAGTTAAGLRAGVPSIVIPFFGDQPFWGRRVCELGVGPQAIPRRQLTAENLADAIHRAVTDREMQVRASALGRQIEAEDGVACAVDLIERYVAGMQGGR
ncbi:MAG: glycosyltransferase [Chloroflexota bacterium]